MKALVRFERGARNLLDITRKKNTELRKENSEWNVENIVLREENEGLKKENGLIARLAEVRVELRSAVSSQSLTLFLKRPHS